VHQVGFIYKFLTVLTEAATGTVEAILDIVIPCVNTLYRWWSSSTSCWNVPAFEWCCL